MNKLIRFAKIAGVITQVLLGGLLIVVGLAMATHDPAQFKMDNQQAALICGEAALAGVLLIIPRTSSLGAMLASAFFGWTLCFHMTSADPAGRDTTAAPLAFLLVTWASWGLRNLGLLLGLKS